MATASDTGNPPRPLAPRLRVGDEIPVFSLPNTNGVSVSSTVLLEPGPLIITFYRGIWCPYCRSDLMALMNATFEVQSRGGSLAAIARETAPNSNRRFLQQHRVDFPIPGSPPTRIAEPGTNPPPQTRSNSAIPVRRRGGSMLGPVRPTKPSGRPPRLLLESP